MIRQKNIFKVYEQVIQRKIEMANFRQYKSAVDDVSYLRICLLEEFSEFMAAESLFKEIGECGDYLGDLHLLNFLKHGNIKKPIYNSINSFSSLETIFIAFTEDICNDLRKRENIDYMFSAELVASYLIDRVNKEIKTDFYQLSIFIHGISLLKMLGRMFRYENQMYRYLRYNYLSLDVINMLLAMERNILINSDVCINDFKGILNQVAKGEHLW